MAVDFTSGYVPPGVYVSTSTTGAVGAVGVGATVTCLLGRGLGYQINTEAVSFANDDNIELAKLGVDPASVVVTGVVLVSGIPTPVTFELDDTLVPHDYSVTQSDGTNPDSVTTVNRSQSGTIPITGTVNVTYHYTDVGYSTLNAFTDFASFASIYGPPLDPTSGVILSPLSLAAQIAFQNGANLVYAVALSGIGTVPSQFQSAYALTLNNFDIDILVPLIEDAVDSGSANAEIAELVAHLLAAENESFPRTAILGLPQNFTGTTPDTIAAQAHFRRVVLIWPQVFTYFNAVLNSTVNLDGFYFAAACAGFLSNNAVNQGLTRAKMRSFIGIPAASLNAATTSKKNFWSSQGVAVVEVNRSGQLVIRHGVTTDPTNIATRELPLVRCQDALFELIQVTLDQADLIGQPITPQTPLTVKGLIAGALETALGNNTIQAYLNLLVRQQSLPTGDPTVIECTFSYQPTYPLNYITVTFTLDLSSGSISNTSDTATGGSNSVNNLDNSGVVQ